MRCLIVDDSRHFLDAARGLLVREGVTVVGTATSAAEAGELVEDLRPDVVLVDIDLGEESGFDLIAHLRSASSPPPMILISTHAEQDYADLIAASPAIGFVPKTNLSAAAIQRLLDRV
ncbi:response regulator transcription factor [Kribbella jiaozuonensis]|uniref:Response regulator n=1 Tax=Kribbella jiaozuonensis TaxID=2575441 RepID=A0A4U3LFJ3_9ACTN|nr:response regulator [Kribbella jiaozuonensis]TKK73679.1 response regulator [Kribbella jiaozuonensis]